MSVADSNRVNATPDDFIEYRRTHDPKLRARLVEQHAGLAHSIARRFEGRGEEREDLRQIALLALVHAVDRFDPDRGLQFSTFAVPTITGTLKRHLRDHAWLVRPPRSVTERGLEVTTLIEALTGTLQRNPTADEVAAAGGWGRCDVEEAVVAYRSHRVHSWESIEQAEVEDVETADEYGRAVDDRLMLEELVGELRSRDRQMIELRYFGELTQSEIAERFGVGQVQVSRLLRRSLSAMQRAAERRAAVPA